MALAGWGLAGDLLGRPAMNRWPVLTRCTTMETGWAPSPLLGLSPGPATPDGSRGHALTHLYKGPTSHFASPFGILILVLAPPGTPEARHTFLPPAVLPPIPASPALFTTPTACS